MVVWLRQNLFSSPLNAALTLLVLALLYAAAPPLIEWAFIDADWSGDSRADCAREGACWVFVNVRLAQFVYGFYPEAARWRVDVAFAILIAAAAPLFVAGVRGKSWIGLFLLAPYPVIAIVLFHGGVFGLAVVETTQWGGLMLTLIVAGVGIVASLPLGVVLALGRQSEMPAIRALCVAFIELWRGVPLITVLFMTAVMLPMFLPEGVSFDKLVRALIGVALFAAAYMAEVVRGGLQAIPRGQYDAAAAIGLTYWQSTRRIVLPQALRIVIPALMNDIIRAFKNTTFVTIIGLFDVLGATRAALEDLNWQPYATEAYIFIFVLYFAFCFSMSKYSENVERRLREGRNY